MKVSELIPALEEFQTKLSEHEKLLGQRAGQRAELSAQEKQEALQEQSRWLSRRLGALRPYIERFDNEWLMQHPATGATWDALDEATSLTGHPGKNHSLHRVFPKLHQILGRLETLDPNAEISADRGTAMSAQEEWISARNAVALLGMGYQLARRTICQRAYAGLIRARAERFVRNGQSADNVDVPREFWWAKGERALTQNWTAGDFDTWIESRIHLEAFGVTFLRSDIERLKPTDTLVQEGQNLMETAGQKIFIGHGHSLVWLELKNFLQDDLHLTIDEFNRVSTAGIATSNRLEQMLDDAAFAFLILTAEDEAADGKLHARENVVHEAGLFQGRLGFTKAIILLEETCEKFTNVEGLGHISFTKGKIRSAFEDIRKVLNERLVGLRERKGRLQYTYPRTARDA